ncbi:hypothetical protein IW262DRAFT_1384605 [Armillaria fumosa]|nr:hypothetical protein IW262DRAFT_1384605 [Armillaria fumosa]
MSPAFLVSWVLLGRRKVFLLVLDSFLHCSYPMNVRELGISRGAWPLGILDHVFRILLQQVCVQGLESHLQAVFARH